MTFGQCLHFSQNQLVYKVRPMMCEPNKQDYSAHLRQLCEVADKIRRSASGDLQQHLRYYINFYVQHKKSSQEFFICLCEHAILNRIFTASSKSLSSLTILELFHLLISNSNKSNDLVYIFSQPIVHEWLFERFNIYKEREDAIQYYVQLLKTIIMKASAEGNEFLIRLFCNKRFPSFPLLTVVTVLGVSETVDELVRITAQQCVLLLINLINSVKTGLVYLNQLQMVVFFYELTKQMFCQEKNQDREGSIKYFIDLANTLKGNQTSMYLLFNLLVNNLYFKEVSSPSKILRFIRELRQQASGCLQFESQIQNIIFTLYRIFCKYYCTQYVNSTYFHAQRIIPAINISSQPKLLKFFAARCQKIDEYLVNQGDYEKSQRGNEWLIDEWLQFNNSPEHSPARSPKKNAFAEFFSSSEDVVNRYIHGVMTMTGLQVQKLKSPIIKLTFSSNFKTSLFLTETITPHVSQKQKIQEEFYKDPCWRLKPSEDFFVQVYLMYLLIQTKESSSLILEELQKYQGEDYFLEKIKPQLARVIAEDLCSKTINVSKNYMLLLFKLIYKLKLGKYLEGEQIEGLLQKLFQLQKMIAQLMFSDEAFCSFLKYVLKNQERAYTREKVDAQSIKSSKFKLAKPKQPKLQHLLFFYEVVQRYLDPSLKALNEFLQDYWQMGFPKNNKDGDFRPLFAVKAVSGRYLHIYPTNDFQFEIRYGNQLEGKLKFTIKQNDFPEVQPLSQVLKFTQLKGQILMDSVETVQNFIKDIASIRQTRKEIFRQAVLEYMPFIYDSIQVRYRSHRSEHIPTPN